LRRDSLGCWRGEVAYWGDVVVESVCGAGLVRRGGDWAWAERLSCVGGWARGRWRVVVLEGVWVVRRFGGGVCVGGGGVVWVEGGRSGVDGVWGGGGLGGVRVGGAGGGWWMVGGWGVWVGGGGGGCGVGFGAGRHIENSLW